MGVREAYNEWSGQYDTNENKTRDLEARALRQLLSPLSFNSCLEIGCGTGKNTVWLMEKARKLTAVDFSENMLARAKAKIQSPHVEFVQADILQPWTFAPDHYELVAFSLVLEHIEKLEAVFARAASALNPGGWLYIGELHPFKQYTGSKARFDNEQGRQVLQTFTHHLTDFMEAAAARELRLQSVDEFFDDDDRHTLPRLLAIVWKKI